MKLLNWAFRPGLTRLNVHLAEGVIVSGSLVVDDVELKFDRGELVGAVIANVVRSAGELQVLAAQHRERADAYAAMAWLVDPVSGGRAHETRDEPNDPTL